jgi:hypothetical protein
VQCNGMEYSVDSFWRSPYARPNEVDWLRLRRLNGTTWIWCDAYPSEVQLFAREVNDCCFELDKRLEREIREGSIE